MKNQVIRAGNDKLPGWGAPLTSHSERKAVASEYRGPVGLRVAGTESMGLKWLRLHLDRVEQGAGVASTSRTPMERQGESGSPLGLTLSLLLMG